MKFKTQEGDTSWDTEKNNQQNGNYYNLAFVMFQVNGEIQYLLI